MDFTNEKTYDEPCTIDLLVQENVNSYEKYFPGFDKKLV